MRTFLPVFIILIIAIAVRRRRNRRLSDASASNDSMGSTSTPMGTVSVDDSGVTHRRSDSSVETLTWNELHDIHIETVAGGLNAAEVTSVEATRFVVWERAHA